MLNPIARDGQLQLIWTERVGGRVVAAFIVGVSGAFIYDRLSNPATNERVPSGALRRWPT